MLCFVCVLPLKTGVVVRLIVFFCTFLPKQFGVWHLTGVEIYLVWPVILVLGIENMPKSWAFSPWQNADPCAHLDLRDPAHSPLVFMGHKRQHLLLAPLVLLPPGPQTFPLEVVMLGITSAVVLLLPFLEVPSSFLGSVSLLCDKAQFAITTCVTLPPPPPDYHYLIRVTAIITTLICGVIHIMIEQYSCCYFCLKNGELWSYSFVLLTVIIL